MNILLNSIIGIISILIGFYLIDYYNKLVKEKKTGGFSFKLRTAGIGLIIIGFGLLIKSIKNLLY